MKAWRAETHGEPRSLQVTEVPLPEPGPHEVRIRVEAIGLNHLDLWVVKGVPGHKFPLPLTLGCDTAGVVDQFGPGAEAALASDGIGTGSPVLVSPGISCGRCEACLSGFDPLCPRYGILGETQDGGCADYLVVPVANVIKRPASLSAAQACALPIPYMTAWTMLVRKAQIKPGETVLIHAGGSGVSIAATQIAKLFGADVITTVSSDEKALKSKALGASHVINYKKGPFRDELKNILKPLGKKGVEVVVDHVGSDTMNESIKSLAWGGRLVTCGATSGSDVTIDLKQIFFKNISILGTTMGSKGDLLQIVKLVAQGKLNPVIDSELPMTKLPEALERLGNRDVFGKIVLRN